MLKRSWKRNWIVLIAVAVHLTWAVLLLSSPAPLATTPLADFPSNNQYVAALSYLVAALLALVPCIWTRFDTCFAGFALTIPQQLLLLGSAWTGILCGVNGQYPDGYVPDGGTVFIWADQAWAIVGGTLHTGSLIDWYFISPNQRLFSE